MNAFIDVLEAEAYARARCETFSIETTMERTEKYLRDYAREFLEMIKEREHDNT